MPTADFGKFHCHQNLAHSLSSLFHWEISFQQTTLQHLQCSRVISEENECNPWGLGRSHLPNWQCVGGRQGWGRTWYQTDVSPSKAGNCRSNAQSRKVCLQAILSEVPGSSVWPRWSQGRSRENKRYPWHGNTPFLGMVNQLGKFSPRISELTQPLRELLSTKQAWLWGPEQEQAFDRVKEEL